jgi:hypothetical protein
MRTRLTLRPGQNGTKKLQQKYGARLVAVRYRYDEHRRLRLKTVELIEEEFPWDPRLPANRDPREIVRVRVDLDEHALQAAVKRAGATFDWQTKTWRLSIGKVYELGITQRMVV